MATRLKTVQFAFPTLASLTNNSLTNLTQITIYLPESGTKTFKSVVAHVSMDDIITATGGTVTTKTVALRLGAAGYTTQTTVNSHGHSGENISWFYCQEFTPHFTTNWTGTSMTCDVQVLLNQTTGTTLGFVNVSVTLDITYEYDDTATTHIKTVMIPLNAAVGALTTGATTYDTAPALDTYLPESSKTYRNIFLVVQGNEQKNAATTDRTLTISFGATSITSGNYEGALSSDRFFRYVFNLTAAGWSSPGSTQNFQLHSSVAAFNHLQAYLVVTYEFAPGSSSTIMNSLMLPIDFEGPMGGTTSSDYQRASRILWIQEPATITLQRLAAFLFWDSTNNVSGLKLRVGTGSFVAYTDSVSTACGSSACMIRNDAPTGLTLARGRNTLILDAYSTDVDDLGLGTSGFFLINYTSGKATDGVGAHNHTVLWSLQPWGNVAASFNFRSSAIAPSTLPETDYFITATGVISSYMTSGVAVPSGYTFQVERLSAEGGIKWESCYMDIGYADPEVGIRFAMSRMRDLFKRFPTDFDSDRMNLFTARRYRSILSNHASAAHMAEWCITYHSIKYVCADNISGFTGTVVLSLHRSSDGEKVSETSRSGDGAYSFTWYDDTEEMFVTAVDATGKSGRSEDTLAV